MRTVVLRAGLIAFAIQCVFVFVGISKDPYTPFDEAAHFDYVVKISKGHLPQVNEKYGQTILEEIACQPSRGEAWLALEACGSAYYSPKNAPFHGQSSATGYPPNYYLVTALPYEVCDRLTSFEPIECGRISNSLWLSASSGLLASLMVIIGALPIVAIVAAIGFNTLPAVLLQGITVNSDAAAQALAPALILFAIYLARKNFESRKLWIIWTVALFIAIPTKPTILPITVIATYLLFDWTRAKHEAFRKSGQLFIPTLSLFGAIALSTAWQNLQVIWRGEGGKDYMTPWLVQPFDSLLTSIELIVVSAISPFTLLTWPTLSAPVMRTLAVSVALLCWVLLFAQRKELNGATVSPRGLVFSPEFSVVSLITAILGPVTLSAYAWFTVGSAPVQPRYYMATLILLGAIGLATTSSIWLIRITTTVLLISSSFTAWYLYLA